MQDTRKWSRDRVIAAAVALAVNGWLAWQLQALLLPKRMAMHEDPDAAALQVVWIAARPLRPATIDVRARQPTAHRDPPSAARPPEARAPQDATATATPPAAAPAPARPMSAVYLQQARQWASRRPEDTAQAEPFAHRPVALAHQSASRFRLATTSPAEAVAKLGKLFGGAGYATDDCGAIDDRLLGLVVAGDARAVQQDLDYERRHCRR